MSTNIHIKGFDKIAKAISEFPAKVEANITRGMLRAGAKPMLEAAKQNVPVGEPNEKNRRLYGGYVGALRDSLRISGRINALKGNVTVSVKAGGKNKKTGADTFYAHMVEFGTRPHSVSKKGKGDPTHPGTSPRPFMRPAFDSQAHNAIIAAGEYAKKRLATKHGLDTADIEIGIEE